jgi:hypothetical protein
MVSRRARKLSIGKAVAWPQPAPLRAIKPNRAEAITLSLFDFVTNRLALNQVPLAAARIVRTCCALILGTPAIVAAQPGAGILNPARVTDWSRAGVAGGIPARTTICATLNPGATASQINSAIAACASNQVVFLNAGTYNLSQGITFSGKDNVTLRGAGANQTRLVFTGDDSCTGARGAICIASSWINTMQSPQNSANWTGGYAKGSSVITLSSTSGMAVGNTVILDQLDDASDNGGVYVCSTAGVCSYAGGNATGRSNRGQQQLVKLVAINGNQVTVDPPLAMPNWRASQNPQAIWVNAKRTGDGVENLTIDVRGVSGGTNGVVFLNATDSWVKGIRSIGPNRNHVWLYQAVRVTVRDSYFWGNLQGVSQSYGIEPFGTTANLVENNIFQHVTAPITVNGTDTSSVYAYNFSIDNFRADVATYMSATGHLHEVGTGMLLFEGNDGLGMISDNWHGTSHFVTYFRNHLYGDPAMTSNTDLMHMCAYSRFFNFVGNVLGRSPYYTTYEPSGNIGGGPKYIWTFGSTCATGGLSDGQVKPTAMRWGNFDTVTGTSRFVASEVPSGLPTFANPVPSTQALPVSMYLSAKPAFFRSLPWPAAGPDVNGAALTGGHAHKIPARQCYESTSQSGGILNFDAAICYGGGGSGTTPPAPAAPTNVRIVSSSQ